MEEKLITIFTPTYNRAKLLERVYLSLYRQTCKNFEWLIIDDGSTDDTSKLIERFIQKNIFTIRYCKKNNAGKHSAMNQAFQAAKGDYFVCIDSDDYLMDDAVQKMNMLIHKVQNMPEISGFVGIALTMDGSHIGKVPKKLLISNTMDIRDCYHIQGEPEVYKTEFLRALKFPIYQNEKFITEAYVFDKLTRDFPLLYSNVPLIYKEFQADGLTSKEPGLRIHNIIGTLHYYQQRVSISTSLRGKIKAMINLNRFYFHYRDKERENHKKKKANLNLYLFYPVSYLIYLSDKRKMGGS